MSRDAETCAPAEPPPPAEPALRHAAAQLACWLGLGEREARASLDPLLLAAFDTASSGGGARPAVASWEAPAFREPVAAQVARLRTAALAEGRPHVALARWPEGRPFAVALTHDVDQIHDRGFYRTLADLNHLRKVVTGREPGRADAACRRLARSLLHPAPGLAAFRRIRELESRHGWRSSWFFLEGHEGRRYGARYALGDPRVHAVAEYLLSEGCEIGVHGGYYDLDDSQAYRRSVEAIERAFACRVAGIRNHYLRWSGSRTWRAQQTAGLRYDASFGRNDLPGFRGGIFLPFRPWDAERREALDLVVLPLTVMDGTLFRARSLDLDGARTILDEILDTACEVGGFVSLLWHNNFFAEDEYADWERAYEEALAGVARRGAICDRADRLCDWWRRREDVRVSLDRVSPGSWRLEVTSHLGIDGLVVDVAWPGRTWQVRPAAEGQAAPAALAARSLQGGNSGTIRLPRLGPGAAVELRLDVAP